MKETERTFQTLDMKDFMSNGRSKAETVGLVGQWKMKQW